jgi:uncharacterized membrane protein YbhN (UPF0104 family)
MGSGRAAVSDFAPALDELQASPTRVLHLIRSPTGRLVLTTGTGLFVLVLTAVAALRFAETSWPLSRGNPGLLVASGALFLVGYALKACGWRLLFAAHERPHPLTLVAANGGASVTALALPGRFDDIVRVAIVRRFRGCPACVRTLCLSLAMLGLIDSAALAPLALAAAVLPGHSLGVRVGLAGVTAVGFAAAALVIALPRVVSSRRLRGFRITRWLRPRTTSFREAAQAWALVSAYWLIRTLGLVILLGAIGVGFSFTLALLFLCATSAAAALPIGPGGTATQAGAGSAVLVVSGVGLSDAVAAAIAAQALGIIVGGSILVVVAAWRTGSRLLPRNQPDPIAIVP